jgi:anti-sigma regulatory factor (Ser/Thr protein kinase)
MPADTNTKPDPRLTLHSRLDDLTLVWPWVDALGAKYTIPAQTIFAIHLCLEEALSNIIRHGYLTHISDKPITVECRATTPRNLIFTIEDQAPPFDPAAPASAEEAPPSSIDQLKVGGRGISLPAPPRWQSAHHRLLHRRLIPL